MNTVKAVSVLAEARPSPRAIEIAFEHAKWLRSVRRCKLNYNERMLADLGYEVEWLRNKDYDQVAERLVKLLGKRP